MDELYRCLIGQQGLPFAVGLLLFLLTLLLVARRIIGFTLSVIFMLLALAAALGLQHQKEVLSFFSSSPRPLKEQVAPEQRKASAVEKKEPATTAPASPAKKNIESSTHTPLDNPAERQKARIQEFVESEK